MKKIYLNVLCTSVLAIVLFACKEDIGNLGLNVQPEDELLNTILFEDTEIAAYAATHDSVVTSNIRLSLLGDINDPVFGRTQAAIYTQCRMETMQVNFGQNPQADSLVLNLAYGTYYGDTLQAIRIRVYELSEDLEATTVYYGHSTLSRKSDLLGEVQIQPTPNTLKDTSTTTAYLSIPLRMDFARDKFLHAGASNLATNANFIRYFKGFYIEAEAISANGCMLSIDLMSTRSAMTLHYRNDEKDNQRFQFQINDSCVRFSHINHFDYAGAEANLSAQLAGNHASASDVLYGQSAGGIKTVIQFPHLKELFAGEKVVIHKAELVVTRLDDGQPNYFPPAALSLSYDRSPTEKNLVLWDYIAFSAAYFGGTYNEANKQYAFRITQYIQSLIDNEDTDYYRLNLMATPVAAQLTRSMFYGTEPAADREKRIKLRIYYTLINN